MRTGAIIQVRYNSTRFPGKVLKSLPFNSNNTVLSQIHNQLQKVKNIDDIIVATSNESDDDIIEDYCNQNNFICVRGSKDDVLKRFVTVIKERGLDVVVRITGDNPIVLVDILDEVIKKHKTSNVDYTRNLNLPYGTSFEVVNAKVLQDISENKDITTSDKEHVTIYIKSHINEYKYQELEHDLMNIDFRFTIDYPSDYAVMNIVFQYLENLNYSYKYHDLKRFVSDNIWLNEINGNNYQKESFCNVQDEIISAIGFLEKLEYTKVVAILKNELR